ncbi:MAG TPA: helix-turn-helix domain-containing protein [Acidimicrobiales bacterium]|jgi:transcriptional regulator with XRE-family HTH domain|nr:helix-turn-helix domain-containing protein [Acidimicrobiales bacterium]
MTSGHLDPLVFGHRLRHLRRSAGLTLDALGAAVGRPASYLSQLENGHREPRLSTVNALASALGCAPAELLSTAAPNRRAELEVALAHMQDEPRYRDLQLPYLRPSARLDDAALEHIVALYSHLSSAGSAPFGPPAAEVGARAANAAMRDEMRKRDNYFENIEEVATSALESVGYRGPGAVSERHLTDVAAHFGFTISRVQDLPPSTRSITDVRRKVVYVPQRNATGGQRSSRSVIAQTLGHFALGHSDPIDFEGYVRQRVEANYFAGALLAPERSAVSVLGAARDREDISVEDLSESFYISYEMAAHRLTNLITRHFDIPIHFQRSDPEGVLWKAYENDGVLLPADSDGTIEGQRLCRWWSSRQAFESEDSYALHYQYTSTVAGTFWCVTHIDLDPGRGDAITVGTTSDAARWFRGSDTSRRATSTCPDPGCCRRPAPAAVRRWDGVAWPSARDHSHFVSGLPTDTVVFSPHPGVEMTDVYSFLDRHSPGS